MEAGGRNSRRPNTRRPPLPGGIRDRWQCGRTKGFQHGTVYRFLAQDAMDSLNVCRNDRTRGLAFKPSGSVLNCGELRVWKLLIFLVIFDFSLGDAT